MRNRKESNARADALIIGGGVVGLAIARELAGRALRVTLVERGRLAAEASHAAGGMLAPQAEADRADQFFQLQSASRDLYPAFAASLRAETSIDIELEQTGTLYLALTAEDEAELERRFLWQTRAGLSVERLTPDEVRSLEPALSPRVRLALRFPLDWQVENRRLTDALSASVEARGVRVLTATQAQSISIEAGRVAGVETSRGYVAAGAVVVAAGAWTPFLRLDFNEGARARAPVVPQAQHPQIVPVRGQMLCFSQPSALPLVRHVVYTPRGYVVPRRDGRLLAGSTTERAGFDKSVTAGGVHKVLAHALEIAPAIGELALFETWAGLRPCAEDEWPVLGASASVPNLFYATGHYRNGILLAPLTAELVADMITGGRATPALDAFSPERFERATA
ncbi:MAG TPA: glycine oxidase ThiO [Pyrinomonadaceae bacterium]|jgi:glycine oxidase|nr:glycine oxidase ThiO [Pyrinomonadaceae bacterium]